MAKEKIESQDAETMMHKEDQYCGACCHFLFEDINGWGVCPLLDAPVGSFMHCSDLCEADEFISVKEKRHHLAMLRKCQRCLVGNVGTGNDIDVEEIIKSIDFVVSYCKVH